MKTTDPQIPLTLTAADPAAALQAQKDALAEELGAHIKSGEALRESLQKYRELNEALERRLTETADELRLKDKLLILQGRQAVMGEMIGNIAHQWRQPLNSLALLVQDLQMTQKKKGLTEEYVDANVVKSLEIIRQMSKTIDYFRYFFKPDTEKVAFNVFETIERTLFILDACFKVHGIRTEVAKTSDPVLTGYPTEFVQVLLNILINARDALITGRPASPLISIHLFSERGKTVVTIADNAGGVPDEIKEQIFDPYFTTKGPEQGTGIGLFMSKTIIEKNMCGRLSVRNVADGAEFRIEV
jgi:two-component system, NtrC family, C4-dicarboxylate transport sensor histidine kinase DctB